MLRRDGGGTVGNRRGCCHAVVETLAGAEASARPFSLALAGPARNLEKDQNHAETRVNSIEGPRPAALVVLLAALLTVPRRWS